MLAEAILDFEEQLPSFIKLAYLPAYGMVRLRLTARGEKEDELLNEIEKQFATLKKQVNQWLVADRDISIQEALLDLLRTNGKSLSTAESCTGGYIAHLLTSIAGSSDVYKGSIISYANEVKEELLDVLPGTLEAYGAVSEQTVQQMVKGALDKTKADYAIATSGIMGPTGGTNEKPVGTVWIAVGDQQRIVTNKVQFRFDRMRNIQLTAHTALNMLRKFVVD
ncbi:MAG: CinA family protein, partial [Candidatus Dadabacteria bacterium]